MFTECYCVPAVEPTVVETLVGVKCTCPKKAYKALGPAMIREFAGNLVSRLILIKNKTLGKVLQCQKANMLYPLQTNMLLQKYSVIKMYVCLIKLFLSN